MNLIDKITAWVLSFTMTASAVDPNSVIYENLSLRLSQKSLDLIIYYESGTKSYYDKHLTVPTVPAWQTTSSGVTVGIGVDMGYLTKSQIREAFENIIKEDEILALQSVSGMKGKNAYYNGLPKVRHRVHLTYEQAEKVFIRYTLPSFTRQTAEAFNLTPNQLHPHSNGALTSLVYNRGASLANTDSRKEMRWIKYNLSVNRPDKVPSDIRSMKRLWSYSKLKGLHLRRDAEAKLFQEGLDSK